MIRMPSAIDVPQYGAWAAMQHVQSNRKLKKLSSGMVISLHVGQRYAVVSLCN